jgi:hypothetical protein
MHRDRASMRRREFWRGALIALALVFAAAPAFAAASLTVSVDEGGMSLSSGKAVYAMQVEVQTTVKLTVTNGRVSQPISWPKVDGLVLNGSGQQPGLSKNVTEYNFFLTPSRAGDFTVPAFDIRTDDGQTLHVGPIKFHAAPHG